MNRARPDSSFWNIVPPRLSASVQAAGASIDIQCRDAHHASAGGSHDAAMLISSTGRASGLVGHVR